MAARGAAAAQSTPDPSAEVQQALVAPIEVVDGDLVRCAIAPYLFLARTSGGTLSDPAAERLLTKAAG